MKCKRCPEGRRYAAGSTICRFYGMIIRDDHECTLERGKQHEQHGYYRHEGYDGAEIRENGGWFAGGLPELLSESGERGGVSEMEEGRETEC